MGHGFGFTVGVGTGVAGGAGVFVAVGGGSSVGGRAGPGVAAGGGGSVTAGGSVAVGGSVGKRGGEYEPAPLLVGAGRGRFRACARVSFWGVGVAAAFGVAEAFAAGVAVFVLPECASSGVDAASGAVVREASACDPCHASTPPATTQPTTTIMPLFTRASPP